MANTKSAQKRATQSLKRRDRNRYYKTTARSSVKKVRVLLAAGDLENAETAMRDVAQSLDKAAQKGCIHKNNAARRKSRLMLQLNQAKAQQV